MVSLRDMGDRREQRACIRDLLCGSAGVRLSRASARPEAAVLTARIRNAVVDGVQVATLHRVLAAVRDTVCRIHDYSSHCADQLQITSANARSGNRSNRGRDCHEGVDSLAWFFSLAGAPGWKEQRRSVCI